MTKRVFRLPKGSLVARYTHIFLVFAFSGFDHMMAHYASGMALSLGLSAFQFFVTQALGIMLEDGFVALYKRYLKPERGSRSSSTMGVLETTLGYLWLYIFLAWSTPVWLYTVARDPPKEPFLPFSAIKRFLG